MTPEQIDAVLPHVPAGIAAMTGDLTDPDDRAVAVAWLWELYCAAANELHGCDSALCGRVPVGNPVEGTKGADEAETGTDGGTA